jgi:DNA modification methylase
MEKEIVQVGNSQTSDEHMRLEHWSIERLIPSSRNARTHSDMQLAEIAGSIKSFGFANPILVSEDAEVIAGHGRLAAARKLGLAEVPVIVLHGLSEVQRRQLMLADNRIAANAGWDLEMLRLELTDLAALGAELEGLGFTAQELARALNGGQSLGLTDEDAVPDLADNAVSKVGDVWCLGPHRIACGDSTNADAVATLRANVHPNLMVTDPPYGIEYDPNWRHRRGVSQSGRRSKIRNDDVADWSKAWELFPGAVAYVWHAALRATIVADSLEWAGFEIRAQIVWAKPSIVIGRGDYHWQHEPCWYAVRKKGYWTGDRKQTTVWQISAKDQDAKTPHSTQKPVECMRRPMQNNSDPGQAVYDPFLGSGTTLIAAESIGRVCIGMELEPRYVDVAVRRWQAFTGKSACLDGDARSFDVIAADRSTKDQNEPPHSQGKQ